MVRRVAMDHIAHAGLVDAEPESDGRHHHPVGAVQKFVLPRFANFRGEAGVIGRRRMTSVAERLRHERRRFCAKRNK